jgi:hypothetical protein
MVPPFATVSVPVLIHRRFELAEGKTSLTMATDLAVRRALENRWIRFNR